MSEVNRGDMTGILHYPFVLASVTLAPLQFKSRDYPVFTCLHQTGPLLLRPATYSFQVCNNQTLE